MKLLHRNVLANKYKITQSIQQLMISDPLYDKDVWCRYENNNINMDRLELFLKKETILHDEESEPFDYSEVIIHLSNSMKNDKSNEQKNYEIGVDTARYVIQTEHNAIEIVTAADGSWGEVTEDYYQGKLGSVTICLTMPDEWIMTEQDFIHDVLSAFDIEQPEMVVLIDEEMNEDINPTLQDEEMKMVT